MHNSAILGQVMEEGIFDLGDSEAEISRLERPANRSNWATPDGVILDLIVPPTVYPPREDTDLLCRTLRTLGPGKGQRCLEIGSGSGAIALYAASLGYRVRACDINPYAVASTRENAKRLNIEVEVHEGGPGPNEDGSVTQWAGEKPHDLIVWNLPYLGEEHAQGDVLGPLEEAALVDTDQKGLVSRLMAQVKKNSLLTNQGMILLLVGGNSKGSNAEHEAQRHGFAARCVATHSFEDGEMLRVIALWTPYASSTIHQHDVVDSTNQLALDTGEQEGDLFVARRQSAGRGRRGRTWSSEEEAFAGSWLLRKGRFGHHPGLVQILSGYAVYVTNKLLGASEVNMALKWPNDVYMIQDKLVGKVSGVLVEGKSKGDANTIVVGIGVNFQGPSVNKQAFPIAYLGREIEGLHREQFTSTLNAVMASFFEHRKGVKPPVFEHHIPALLAHLKMGERVLGHPYYRNEKWMISNLDSQGNLVIENSDGEQATITDGEDIEWPNLTSD